MYRSDRLDEGFAQGGEEPCEGDRAWGFRPGHPVHRDEEPTRGERRCEEEDFEVSVSAIILYRNSKVWFHKGMVAGGFMKVSRARRRANPLYNHC